MAANCIENMRWMAAHIHCFQFHTPQAVEFKVELQAWWRDSQADEDQAALLQDAFSRMCQASPVDIASGWYWHGTMNTAKMAKFHRFSDDFIPRADITPTCPESCYLPERDCFNGMLPPAQRVSRRDLLERYRAVTVPALERTRKGMVRMMELYTTRQYDVLIQKGNHYSLFKALLHGLLLGFALRLFPLWLTCVLEIVHTFLDYGWDGFLMLQQIRVMTPGSILLEFPGVLLLTLLVPAVYLDLPQTFCEVWFGIYRFLARTTLRHSYARATRTIRRMLRLAGKSSGRLNHAGRLWRRNQKSLFFGLRFDVPRWVRLGRNSVLTKRFSPAKFRKIIRIYPTQPPKGRSWCSRPLLPLLTRALILFFFVVITLNL